MGSCNMKKSVNVTLKYYDKNNNFDRFEGTRYMSSTLLGYARQKKSKNVIHWF